MTRIMKITRLVASLGALCLMTGLVVYGGIFLWPRLAESTQAFMEPVLRDSEESGYPRYLYSVGGEEGPVRPNAIALGEKGRVYITDAGTGRVFVYSEKGRKLFDFGGPGNGSANLVFPNGIVVTADGNLMIADSVKNEVKLFSAEGKYIRTLLGHEEKIRPGIMSRGPDGLVYISDLLNNEIHVINEQGKALRKVAGSSRPLSYPQGTAVDTRDRLWVADGGSYSLRIFDKTGKESGEIKGGGKPETPFSLVRGIAFDKSGRTFVSDTIARQIRVFDDTGKQLYLFPEPESGQGELVYPTNMLADTKGRLWVVDRGANDIKVFSLPE